MYVSYNIVMANKILLIEDDQLIREMYVSELNRAGFEVSACASGEEGLAALQQSQFDLVLLDILLPGINGLEVLKRIKQDPQTKWLKVVLLTNLGQETIIQKGFNLGALGFLIKAAYNTDQIIAEVKKFIAGDSNDPPDQKN